MHVGSRRVLVLFGESWVKMSVTFGRAGLFEFWLHDGIYPRGGASEKRGTASSRTIRLSC